MIQKTISIIVVTCLFVFGLFGLSGSTISANSANPQIIDDPTKEWTITFNTPVLNDHRNLQRIYVQSSENVKHEVSIQISADLKKVIVKPKNPYHFGKNYILVIPKDFQSATGIPLKKDVTKQFQIQGKVIANITAIANPLATNIIVKGTNELAKVTYAINGSQEQDLFRNSGHFSRGQQGLAKGDLLTIRAYDVQNNLLEAQVYEVN